MTELPLPDRRNSRQRGDQPPTVAIALFVGFILTAAFVGLASVVIPGVLLMVLAGMGMLVFFVLQYFLWARWLYPIVVKLESGKSTFENAVLPDVVPATPREIDP